jgi:hypothetical protein
MVGDWLTIEVPYDKLSKLSLWKLTKGILKYSLPPGTYNFKVTEKLRCGMRGFKAYQVHKMAARKRGISFIVFIPTAPELIGYLFLDKDDWPVRFTHEPNLTERLRRSYGKR